MSETLILKKIIEIEIRNKVFWAGMGNLYVLNICINLFTGFYLQLLSQVKTKAATHYKHLFHAMVANNEVKIAM